MIKAGTLASPLGPGKHPPVAAEDQARVIVGILEDPATARSLKVRDSRCAIFPERMSEICAE
jgi:hypothetical protein